MKRYPGTAPFKTEDAAIFKGREKETQEVTNLVLNQKMLTLFAVSGMGKTSLLNAGVAPRLGEYDCYSFTFRFNEGADSNPDPVERFCRQYEVAHTEFYHIWQNKPAFSRKYVNNQLSLWRTLNENPLAGFTPVLIFDQFEEFFRTYPLKKDRAPFLRQLADLLLDYVPYSVTEKSLVLNGQDADEPLEPLNIRIVFSIRSDTLVYMQEVSEYIPFVKRFQYELRPMNDTQAEEAVVLPGQMENRLFETGKLTYTREAISQIIDGAKNSLTQDVESFQLQLICNSIENALLDPAQPNPAGQSHTITPENYGGPEGIKRINEKFVQTTLKELTVATGVDTQTVLDQLVELLNSAGHRIIKSESELQLPESIRQALVEKRILKRDQIAGKEGFYYEISHDKIAEALLDEKVQKERRENQKKLDENNKRIRQQNILVLVSILAALIAVGAAYSINKSKVQLKYKNDELEANRKRIEHDEIKINSQLIKIKGYSAKLAKTNRQLDSSAKSIQRTIRSNFWSTFVLAKGMMKGHLFNQAFQQFDTLVNNIGSQSQLVEKEEKKLYNNLIKRAKEGREVARAMGKIQVLVEKAECFEKNFDLWCARAAYVDAIEYQKKNKYRFYHYTDLGASRDRNVNEVDNSKRKRSECKTCRGN